ncbi:DNA gyrase subunit A [Luteitalea pratensis]|uniref:DNA topoisomerase (ATP-hydrolyzing) n=1 Tax=Luteitalea pratensis TaxID=1855912 RepID=A0A143PR94_LUTPR|nr:DNA topoisomerase IV subunit A [Luteitalea pratensis]AMY10334.1 DNA gyrase subunit A [Luteitalea pratensis]
MSSEPNLFDLPGAPNGGSTPPPPTGPGETDVALHDAAQTRYLNYALSVITSRALPDVRDGLKPVQRRILYTMWQQNLTADAKHRKCAKVVGDVMGNYHPHGDSALYETLVRMAQSFSLRYPLVDGSGNFGSLDGDGAAAMRYTECRLARISDELLSELDQDTVPFRPNYDGTRTEPVVLPARVPTLLINGAMGIAVGMATNIPPHHLGEVCTALLRLIDNPELTTLQLCKYVKGPDFPTGGQILNSPDELKEIYRTGSGAIRLRGTWEKGEVGRSSKVITITAIPYTVDKSELVTRIADLVISRKLPPLLDVRDVSTDDIRVELEIKRDADEALIMAYLCRHTPLQVSLGVNLTCLIPTEQEDIGRPERLDLKAMLWHFLHFRMEVVNRRLEYEAAAIARRVHILEGFEKVFDALDRILEIVRKSDGKADAAAKIIAAFGLDAEQADAILELKVYRLARLEILIIRRELADKRERQAEIIALLGDEPARWALVRSEIAEVQKVYSDTRADRRRTTFASDDEVVEYDAEAFIIEEDNVVVVSRDGWIKRQKEVKDPATTRLREGDEILAAVGGSTRATLVLFTTQGGAYTCRFIDVPASTGYGEPVQRFFKFKDGERVVAVMSLDPRVSPGLHPKAEGETPPRHALAASSDGYALRFSLAPYIEPSTRAGRKFVKLPDGVEVVGVAQVTGEETIIAATREARAMLCAANEVNVLSGPGRGVILIKIDGAKDRLLGFIASRGDRDLMVVETSRGAEQTISTAKYEVTARGGKGRELLQRGSFTRVVPPAPQVIGVPE